MPSRKFQIQRNQKLYCKKPVQYGTKKFEVGDVFPYKKLEVSWKRVVSMYAGYTLIGENDTAFDDVMEQKRIRLAGLKGEKPVQEKEVQAEPTPEKETRVVTLFNRGRGWFDVLVNGKQVNKSALRKKAATARMEKLKNG